jgi:hypothetical protein
MVSGSIYKLSRNKKWRALTDGKGVNPHKIIKPLFSEHSQIVGIAA